MSEQVSMKLDNPIGRRLREEMQRQWLRCVVPVGRSRRVAPLALRVRVELATLGKLTRGTRLRLWVARCVGAL